MFKIDLNANRIMRLEEKRFGDLNLRERNHLQEWIANMPDALGEELLIIQKEFDGFDDTRERLDLLALDKEGRLVLIENKLDDTGRDVVWQAIKYAAYVSSLNKNQIADIFQQYLDRHHGGGNAVERICEFLGEDEFDEVVLNSGNSQRLVLVAAHFRREVTAAALWLLGHGITTQCFTVRPFLHGADAFLDIKQIIPVPEAAEFMIGIARKDSEERASKENAKERHNRRSAFWAKMLERLRNSEVKLYNNVSPSRDHWLSAGCGLAGCHYSLIFGRDEARVELNFTRSSAEENKRLFDFFHEQKDALEEVFGGKFIWDRGDDGRKASRIQFSQDFDGYDEQNWPEMIEWLTRHIGRLEKTMASPLALAGQRLRQR
ncbi:DUF4268 domain-containing protein [Devosia sp.]|uniref:DUF4268 domain-containing protein n=1 Tax=Devosia sp. TaxID=1871048 RepID=UPI003F703A98